MGMTNAKNYEEWVPLYRSSRNVPPDLKTYGQLRALGLSCSGQPAAGRLSDREDTRALYSQKSVSASALNTLQVLRGAWISQYGPEQEPTALDLITCLRHLSDDSSSEVGH